MKLSIKKTNSKDRKKLNDFFNSLSFQDLRFLAFDFKEDEIKREIVKGENCYLVYNKDNKDIVGFLRKSEDNEEITLEELVVNKKYRGNGIGEKMLTYLEKHNNIGIIKTKNDNTPMKNLLTKKGYKGTPKKETDIIIWKK